MIFQEFLHSPWLYYTLMTVYALSILTVIIVILSENRSPVKSLAWMTVLLVMPVVGLVLYIFFGRNIQRKRLISRRNQRKLRRTEPSRRHTDFRRLKLLPQSVQLVKLTHSLAGAVYHEGNSATVFTHAAEKMDALISDIDNATDYVNIEYYIIEDDTVGQRLKRSLIDAARRGVKVRVIYDHVGSFSAGRKFWRELREAGVDVHPFFKVVFPLFATRINWRNHRKIAIIDGRSAYIGGMNIADRYLSPTWRDLHVRIQGPAVRALQYCFAVDWTFMGQPLVKDDIPQDIPLPEKPMGIQLVTSGPTGKWPNISMVFQRAIANARRRVYIMTPYFLPDDALLRAMQTAALARVDVRILIPRNPDSAVMRHASFSYISQCLTAGMKVYLYEGGMMHSKALIIDYDMVSVGSTNFDFRSFEHNFEANVLVYSQDFNARITEEFRDACLSATRVVASEWRRRPLINRAIQSVVRLLAPIL